MGPGTSRSTCATSRSLESCRPENGPTSHDLDQFDHRADESYRRMASLNELRCFFGLKEYDTFEEINPDPEIADILAKLYDSPDMVEMYPGLFIEDIKKRMDPGSGIGIPFTAGRAVLSDAVGFIRGDRFFTVVSLLNKTRCECNLRLEQDSYYIPGLLSCKFNAMGLCGSSTRL